MGRTRGGKRRTVLQLGDQKESYLNRYGYSRQEDNDEESNTGNQNGGESETDEELEGHQNVPEDDMEEIPLPPVPSTEVVKPKVDIDDKVANFLAEIDALDPEEEPSQSEVDTDLKPSFAPIDPKPSFQLNVDQVPSYMEKQETKIPVKQESKSTSSYKNMFVQGASEFTRPKEDNVTSGKKEIKEQWPDEPISDWQQILDDNTQCYYYWNVQTNDVRWEIPPEYTQYLLLRKEYEEKTERLIKEGKKQPSNPRQIRIAVDGHHLIEPDSSAEGAKAECPKLPPSDKGSDETPCVSSTSNVLEQTGEASKKNSKQGNLKAKTDTNSFGPQLPDSTAAKSKKPKLQLPKEEETKSSSSSKKSTEKSLKKKTLVEEMREQVQKKQEIEARRKAAIEEMMARELERRVGPPRQSSIPEEPAFRPKVMDYEHGRKKSKSADYDNESSRSHESNRDSKRKRDDRKTEKDRDRKRRKDDKDSHRKDRDEKDERKKEKDDKKKDKDRHREKDDKKSDSKKREERSSKDEEKQGSKKKEEKDKAEKKKPQDESESKDQKVKVEPEIVVVPEVDDTESDKKTESKEVLLANMRLEHYEKNAAPPGWSCHWDSAGFHRCMMSMCTPLVAMVTTAIFYNCLDNNQFTDCGDEYLRDHINVP
ncbi:hypothetical protein KUTeg_022991 [Tegillarca granosa]|uniref:WW domain-containing protein n=1 Tax=Tegillarca granosa TaxID=220873 RepID=A0ABQ9E5A8_TEGGR|nr:hypothetical protein KUTeg_022991 [Tegillarca granosa]